METIPNCGRKLLIGKVAVEENTVKRRGAEEGRSSSDQATWFGSLGEKKTLPMFYQCILDELRIIVFCQKS